MVVIVGYGMVWGARFRDGRERERKASRVEFADKLTTRYPHARTHNLEKPQHIAAANNYCEGGPIGTAGAVVKKCPAGTTSPVKSDAIG